MMGMMSVGWSSCPLGILMYQTTLVGWLARATTTTTTTRQMTDAARVCHVPLQEHLAEAVGIQVKPEVVSPSVDRTKFSSVRECLTACDDAGDKCSGRCSGRKRLGGGCLRLCQGMPTLCHMHAWVSGCCYGGRSLMHTMHVTCMQNNTQ